MESISLPLTGIDRSELKATTSGSQSVKPQNSNIANIKLSPLSLDDVLCAIEKPNLVGSRHSVGETGHYPVIFCRAATGRPSGELRDACIDVRFVSKALTH
jgi:hypothetical protein